MERWSRALPLTFLRIGSSALRVESCSGNQPGFAPAGRHDEHVLFDLQSLGIGKPLRRASVDVD
jgi:hypothetical protein